jgi:hypothetical protein
MPDRGNGGLERVETLPELDDLGLRHLEPRVIDKS